MSDTTPFIPGPTNDTIDLEQVGLKGAMNLSDENDPTFKIRRGQIVRLTVLGVVEKAEEGSRRSANTQLTFRKWVVDATDLEEFELVDQPEARARKDGQIEGQLPLSGKVPDDAGDPRGISEADAKAQKPDLGKQVVLYTLPDGGTIDRGSRWLHRQTGMTYRAMAAAKSGDEAMVYVADSNDAEDAFPLQSFGDTLVSADPGGEIVDAADAATPAEVDAALADAVAPGERDGNGPVEHAEDVKGALGDAEA